VEFDNSFSVAAPIEEVWEAVLDLERVAPCLPGAQVLEQTADNAYKVSIKVKLGPVSMTYKGDVEVVARDDAAHQATIKARAREVRGQGMANATVEMRLSEEDGGTHGTIHSDVAISGKAAAMGQRVIADVSAKLIETFAENLAAMLPGPPAAEVAPEAAAPTPTAADSRAPAAATPPASAEGLPILSLVGSAIVGRMRDPRVAIPALAALAALVVVLRRRAG
jgi:carbon monoxide dehydrogenase subunit G